MKRSCCDGIYVALLFTVAGAGLSPTRRSRIPQRRTSTRTPVWSFLMGVALLTALNCNADVKVKEQVVGPAWEAGTIYWLSPKGMHLATMHAQGSRFVVTIDGVDGEKFDEILQAAAGVEVVYDSGGSVVAVPVRWRGPVAFSPDGSRYAYAARQGKEVVVILDGKEIFARHTRWRWWRCCRLRPMESCCKTRESHTRPRHEHRNVGRRQEGGNRAAVRRTASPAWYLSRKVRFLDW
jgi:hypothetical protein